MAKVSCILRHRGVQLILAYSCARLSVLVGGKGIAGKKHGGAMLLFLLFIFILSSLSLSFISFTISSVSFLLFPGGRHRITHKG